MTHIFITIRNLSKENFALNKVDETVLSINGKGRGRSKKEKTKFAVSPDDDFHLISKEIWKYVCKKNYHAFFLGDN